MAAMIQPLAAAAALPGLTQALGLLREVAMPFFFNAIFLLAFASMFVVYPLYFMELAAFGKMIRKEHAAYADKEGGLATAYQALNLVKDGELEGVALSKAALSSHTRAKRFLYVGASAFLLVLFIGLADSE